MYIDNVKKKFRSIYNANFQFWSILTLITLNEIQYRIDKEGLTEDILIVGTIYDSIYFEVKEDAEIIKWLNDNITEISERDFLQNQLCKNMMEGGLSDTWTDEIGINKNASIQDIENIIEEINNREKK